MNKTTLWVIAAVIVAAAVYFGIVRNYGSVAYHTPTPTTVATSTRTNTPVPTSLSYTNKQFGFDLDLPASWKGYKVFSSEGSQGVGAPTYLDFAMPTTDKTKSVNTSTGTLSGYVAILTITAISKDRNYQGAGIKITEDSENVYYYSINKDLPKDLRVLNFEIPKVISSFSLGK